MPFSKLQTLVLKEWPTATGLSNPFDWMLQELCVVDPGSSNFGYTSRLFPSLVKLDRLGEVATNMSPHVSQKLFLSVSHLRTANLIMCSAFQKGARHADPIRRELDMNVAAMQHLTKLQGLTIDSLTK